MRLVSDTAGTVPRDRRNRAPVHTGGSLAYRPENRSSYFMPCAPAPVTPDPGFLIPGEPDWNRRTRSIQKKKEILHETQHSSKDFHHGRGRRTGSLAITG